MPDSLLDLNLLRVFMAIYRNGNITKAAEELSVTQSSVSQSLSKLRAHFDDPLFVKIATGVKPTQTATDLCTPIEEILTIAQTAFGQASHFEPATLKRTITICVSGVGEMVVIPPLLKALQREAPHCRLRTVNFADVDINSAMKSGEVDITITGEIKPHDDIFQQRLFTDTFAPIVNVNSPLPDTLTLEQFRQQQLITPSPNRNQTPVLLSFLAEHGMTESALYASASRTILPLAVFLYPEVVCVVPAEAAKLYQQFEVARMLETDFEMPKMPICQYWHRVNAHTKYMRWLRGLIYRTLNENPIF